MKAELTAPWRKTANTDSHLKDDNKDFPSFHPPKWLKRNYVHSLLVIIMMIKSQNWYYTELHLNTAGVVHLFFGSQLLTEALLPPI